MKAPGLVAGSLIAVYFVLSSASASAAQYLSSSNSDQRHYLLAENDIDDTYDPFSDYSEFDEASDEEADINFFRNGRFFTVGMNVGMRGFTGNLNKIYSSAPTFGLFLTYFFDLRLAMELGFQTGDHNFEVVHPSIAAESLRGNVSLTFLNVNLKYYFNTQNVTRGLADVNPYLTGGFSQVYRTYTIEGGDVSSREATVGVNTGLGVEIPIMRRKAFVGLQGVYRYVNFKDENTVLVNSESGNSYGITPKGDSFDAIALLGLSF